jgi:cytochrome P450
MEIFGQDHDNSFRVAWGDTPVSLDPPAHQPMRALVTNAIDRMQIERVESEVLRPAATLLADEIAKAGNANLVTQYTGLIPFLVIVDLLGLDPSDFRWIMNRVRAMMALGVDWDSGIAAAMELYEYLSEIYESRVKHPREDLISDLIRVEIDGRRLTRDQVLSFCRILLPAGIETTTKQFGNLMVALLTKPSQMALAKSSKANIEAAVQEATRWEAPIMMGPKRARVATTLDGVPVPAGAHLLEVHGYADHDGTRWKNPHEFDLSRPRQATVAFGAGPHFCPGTRLARMEMEVGVEILLKRLPNLRLDPEKQPPRIRGFMVRTTPEIHVLA